jgi:5-hydroxyisourate hydrolase
VTTLSTHVLDVERGVPAGVVPIALFRGEQQVALAETNADGRIGDMAGGGSLEAGTYRLVFDVAAYFARRGGAADFLRRVAIDFQVDASDLHYHVPLLLSPYACTSYRGG